MTFRLAGSLPRAVVEAWAAEKTRLEEQAARMEDKKQQAQLRLQTQRDWFRRVEACLDKAQSGPLWLKDPRLGRIIADRIRHRDGKVYQLEAFTVMPNHVHLAVTPLLVGRAAGSPGEPAARPTYHALTAILHSLKSYTAGQAN